MTNRKKEFWLCAAFNRPLFPVLYPSLRGGDHGGDLVMDELVAAANNQISASDELP